MNFKKTIEQALFFLDNLNVKHHKLALTLKIGLWCIAPLEMLGFTLTKRAYRKYVI